MSIKSVFGVKFSCKLMAILFLCLLGRPGTQPAFSGGMIIYPPPWLPPIIPEPPDAAEDDFGLQMMPLTENRARIIVEGGVTRTKVHQTFFNPLNRRIEGTFVFPLPENAAITSFGIKIDDEIVEAELLDARTATGIYEDIVRKKRDPALLEWVGRALYRARIFPVEAKSEIQIQLSFSEKTKSTDRQIRHLYDMTMLRLSPEPVRMACVNVVLNLPEGVEAVYSPTHDIDVARKGREQAMISWEQRHIADSRDFILYATRSEGLFGLSFLTHRTKGEPGYFVALLAPAFEIPDFQIRPKDLVLVLDTSGSMAGERIRGARKALIHILNSLEPEDRFEIIEFATVARPWKNRLVRAEPANISAGIDFIRELRARGGTNIAQALDKAMAMKRSERQFMVILITDGAPTIGIVSSDEIVERAVEALDGARLFTLGIGDEVNSHLLDRLAASCGGTSDYAINSTDVEYVISAFYDQMRSPVLTNLKVEPVGFRITDVHPRVMPDLFLGSQTILSGRYDGSGHRMMRVVGDTDTGETELAFNVDLPEADNDNSWIPAIWASREIAYLLDEIRLRGENQELREEIVRLARKYGIVTPYTSFLVVEDVAYSPDMSEDILFREMAESAAQAGYSYSDLSADTGIRGLRTAISTANMKNRAFLPNQADFGEWRIAESDTVSALQKRHVQQVRHVNNRVFYRHDQGWKQSGIVGIPAVDIAFAGELYFALLREYPGLGPVFALGHQVSFLMNDVVIRISDRDNRPAFLEAFPEITLYSP